MPDNKPMTGYPSIDKPWLKYYTDEAINAPLPECTIYDYLWESNKERPDDVALIYGEQSVTYRELFQNIDKTASAFVSLGVRPGDTVTMMVLNQPETVYCFYALNKIRAVVCVVNVLSNVNDLVHYLDEGRSQYFVTLDLFEQKALAAARERHVKAVIRLSLFPANGKTETSAAANDPSDPAVYSWADFLALGHGSVTAQAYEKGRCALVGHTGGTTGMPKGIMLTDDSINFCVFQFGQKWSHARGDRFLNLVVPFAVYGFVMNIHMPLVFGMSCILIPKVDPKTTDELLIKYKPNHIISVPSYWNAIAESQKLTDLSFLKIAGAGGSKMEPGLEMALNELFREKNADIHFMNGYGMSEVGSIASAQSNDCAEIGSVGIPLIHNVISAFDVETQEEMPTGREGELCILSPSIMLGYIDNPAENAHVMRKHADGRTWIHTGDLGYISEKGSVFITGRIKRIYITQINGTVSKIFPDRVEKIISEHPAISNCCVVCKTNVENTYSPVAYIVLKAQCESEPGQIERELVETCHRELPEYSQPAAYIFVDALPLTSVGKVDYRALEEMAKEETNNA